MKDIISWHFLHCISGTRFIMMYSIAPEFTTSVFLVLMFIFYVLPGPSFHGAQGGSSSKKHSKGKPLTSKQKEIALNVYDYFKTSHPKWTVEQLVDETSKACGVSSRSIHRIRKEFKEKGSLITPRKRKPITKGALISLKNYDDFTLSAVRSKVHSFFLNNEPPTLNKVKRKIDEDSDLQSISRAQLHRILKAIGFRFKKRSRKSLLIERDDLIAWRHKYLRQIRQYRQEKRPIFFLDETWCFAGMTTPKAWVDTTVKTKRQAFLEGLSTGLKDPTGRGERLIVLHVGNQYGFLDGAGLVYRTTGILQDYHGDMNGDIFKKWFEKELLPRLPPKSVIVMDNASYHSVLTEKLPTTASTKKTMQDWLSSHNIHWDAKMTKRILYDIIKQHKDSYKEYVVDKMAQDAGFDVLRLPPYHCDLNPIEMVWSQVKRFVEANNKTYKIDDVQRLTDEAIANVTPIHWNNYCEKVQKVENDMWRLEGLMDDVVDRIIISIGGDSDSDSDTDFSAESDIEDMEFEEIDNEEHSTCNT